MQNITWYGKNTSGAVQPVGRKKANIFGLHDMSGNVWEWCSSHFSSTIPHPVIKGGDVQYDGDGWYLKTVSPPLTARNYLEPNKAYQYYLQLYYFFKKKNSPILG